MQSPVPAFGIEEAQKVGRSLCDALSKVIRGRSDTIQLIITALLADGHALVEDYPGSGKTTLAKTLGRLIAKDHHHDDAVVPFRRIQFTPDMLPGDVLGVNVFEPTTGTFRFIRGPIFAHVVLADEINRTGPKVQSAFLECMAEKQVTLDTTTYPLDDLFFVIGTQNPLDMAGTYPLPQVQLDRFLLKIPMSYVDAATELEILEEHQAISKASKECTPVCTREEVLAARAACDKIFLNPALRKAVVELIQRTRTSPLIQFGASTRAALMLQSALKAAALLAGRDHANEDDLKRLAGPVVLHRLKFHPGAGAPAHAFHEIVLGVVEELIRRS